MKNNGIADFIKPTIITAQQYGTKVSVEIDHSDTDIDELFEAFQTICVGLGYHQSAWKNWIVDRADEYRETDAEDLKEQLTEWQTDELADVVFHNKVKWDENQANERMDVIGQNGNEGLHYRATDEDEAEFDDYGARIVTDSSFEWGDEEEVEPSLPDDGTYPEPNEKLKEGYKKYKKALKTLSSKQKKKSK